MNTRPNRDASTRARPERSALLFSGGVILAFTIAVLGLVGMVNILNP